MPQFSLHIMFHTELTLLPPHHCYLNCLLLNSHSAFPDPGAGNLSGHKSQRKKKSDPPLAFPKLLVLLPKFGVLLHWSSSPSVSLAPASPASFLLLAFFTNGFPPYLINVAPLPFIKRAAIFLSSHPTQTDHLLPCTPCISSFPLKLMKRKSAAIHQWRRPDYPDQGVCVHTNCTLMESLSYHPLFGHNIV